MSKRTSTFDGADNAWVRDYLKPRYPELVRSYLEASRIFRSSKKRGVVSAKEINKLVAYASSTRTPLGENVATMLGELYDIDERVAVAIRGLAAGREVHERINALVALDSCRTTELHDEILAALLLDRSGRVRALAADKIVGHGMLTLLGRLKEAHLREARAVVREEFEADIGYLKRGLHVRWTRRANRSSMTPNKSLERMRGR